jgi:hypothetical protein
VQQLRSTSAVSGGFPYTQATVCYIEVQDDGAVTQGADHDAYLRAKNGESRLYAVWPGKWRSDLFIIDDLDDYARAIGIAHDTARTGLVDHEHSVKWSTNQFETSPAATYITIDVWMDCGCRIADIRTFADHMKTQRGWDVATTAGWGGGGDRQYVRVRRRSLDEQSRR